MPYTRSSQVINRPPPTHDPSPSSIVGPAIGSPTPNERRRAADPPPPAAGRPAPPPTRTPQAGPGARTPSRRAIPRGALDPPCGPSPRRGTMMRWWTGGDPHVPCPSFPPRFRTDRAVPLTQRLHPRCRFRRDIHQTPPAAAPAARPEGPLCPRGPLAPTGRRRTPTGTSARSTRSTPTSTWPPA